MENEIKAAIENMSLIEFYYDGGQRIVEPHCYGLTTAGNEGLRAFQIDGYTSSGRMGWKMFDVSNISNLTILDVDFDQPRPGYRPGDRGMIEIFIEL